MTKLALPDHATAGRRGLCLDCNYPLEHLSSQRCPECGRPFDPADPSSMNMGRALGALVKWALGPIRAPIVLATLLAIGFTLWTARLPGGRRTVPVLSIGLLVAIGSVWIVWPLLRIAMARRFGWSQQQLTAGRKPRLLMGTLTLLAAAAVVANLPMSLAIRVSRPRMDALATQVINSPDSARADRWVGAYKARNIYKVPGGIKFTVEDTPAAGHTAGFIYLPKVDPSRANWRAYKYVGGGWWTWFEET